VIASPKFVSRVSVDGCRPKHVGRPKINLVRDEYGRSLVRSWLADRSDGRRSLAQLARELHVSPPALSMLLAGDRSVGPDIEQKMATKFHGGSVDAFRAAAARYGEDHGISNPTDDPYPSRDELIRLAKAEGYSVEVLERLRSIRLQHPKDPGVLFWASQLHWISAAPAEPRGEPVEAQKLPAASASPKRTR